MYIYIYMYHLFVALCRGATSVDQCHVQVVVAGVVVTKALFWTDIVTVFGLLVTDFGPGCYDHLNYNHLSAVHSRAFLSRGLG